MKRTTREADFTHTHTHKRLIHSKSLTQQQKTNKTGRFVLYLSVSYSGIGGVVWVGDLFTSFYSCTVSRLEGLENH
jgi:hypothetical protein